MKLKKGKIFRVAKDPSDKLEIVIKKYDETEDNYYKYIRENNRLGLRQVIVTSEIMMKLIKTYVIKRKFRLNNIDFMVEDENLDNEVNMYINKLNEDRVYLTNLLDYLNFLHKDDSIDIKSITLQGRSLKSNKDSRIIIQVNGLFSISDYSYESEVNFLEKIILNILGNE